MAIPTNPSSPSGPPGVPPMWLRVAISGAICLLIGILEIGFLQLVHRSDLGWWNQLLDYLHLTCLFNLMALGGLGILLRFLARRPTRQATLILDLILWNTAALSLAPAYWQWTGNTTEWLTFWERAVLYGYHAYCGALVLIALSTLLLFVPTIQRSSALAILCLAILTTAALWVLAMIIYPSFALWIS